MSATKNTIIQIGSRLCDPWGEMGYFEIAFDPNKKEVLVKNTKTKRYVKSHALTSDEKLTIKAIAGVI